MGCALVESCGERGIDANCGCTTESQLLPIFALV